MGLKERLLGVHGFAKRPTLVIYWGDTRELLDHFERLTLLGGEYALVDVTPLEVLLQSLKTGRKVVIRGITDDALPDSVAELYELDNGLDNLD